MALSQQTTRVQRVITAASLLGEALRSPTRVRILLTLEDRSLSFTELSNKMRLEEALLVHHLSKLVSAQLVAKKTSPDPASKHYRLYEITEDGRYALKVARDLHRT